MTEKNEERPTSDMWDRLDNGTYWLPLAPTTASEYFSGETDNLFVSRDGGQWWLSHSAEQGSDPYDDVCDAKAVGERMIEESYNKMESLIVDDLGIPTEEWGVEFDNGGITVKSKENPDIAIYGSDGEWSMEGDLAVQSRNFTRVFEIAKGQLQAVAPAPFR